MGRSARSKTPQQDRQAAGPAPEPARQPAPTGAQADVLALQRKAGNRAVDRLLGDPQGQAPPIVEEVLRSGGGRPLDPVTQSFMEERFGEDFSQVRVHADAKAAESAEVVNARAYTVGRDVIFGSGEYQPEVGTGKRLLAHELAHVVQQLSVMVPASPTEIVLDATNSPAEAAAERASDTVLQPAHGQLEHAGQLAAQADVGRLQVQRQPASPLPTAELQRDIERIKDELDSLVYTEGVEERVIGILRRWAEGGSFASGYLDWIFDGLQERKSGIFGDTTYYDAMLDEFDRADEVRQLREGTRHYGGRESTTETRRRAEEKAERRETDIAADVAGGWTENLTEPYDLPPTPENLARAKLEVRRLSMIPSDQLLPIERAASELVSQQGAKALLRKYHFVTESERIERRKEQMRAIARPLLEILLWVTAERLAAFAVEAIAARLFTVEAEAVTALTVAEGEAVAGALARAEGRLVSAEGQLIVRESYTYQIKSINAITGEVEAVGHDLVTGEVVNVRMNIDTGTGFATRAGGETLPIQRGRVDLRGTVQLTDEAAARLAAKEPLEQTGGKVLSLEGRSPAGTFEGLTPGQREVTSLSEFKARKASAPPPTEPASVGLSGAANEDVQVFDVLAEEQRLQEGMKKTASGETPVAMGPGRRKSGPSSQKQPPSSSFKTQYESSEGVRSDPSIPLGFRHDPTKFEKFSSELYSGLEEAALVEPALEDVTVVFQGSSVRGVSNKGEPFDVGRISDFDIALASPSLAQRASDLGIGLNGPLSDVEVEMLKLTDVRNSLALSARRPVNFLVVESVERAQSLGPSIVVPR